MKGMPDQDRLMEVAHLLPPDAAKLMMELPESSRLYVLKLLAVTITFWEESKVSLDPVQFEIVLTSIVTALKASVGALDASLNEISHLRAMRATCEQEHCKI